MNETNIQPDFPSSPTTLVWGKGFEPAFRMFILGWLAFILLASLATATDLMFIAYPAFVLIVATNVGSVAILIFGRFKRIGDCPHCATPIAVYNSENSETKCSGCDRRLLLRGEKITT